MERSPSPVAESREFKTDPNEAGIFRVYPVRPTTDPDAIIGLEDICNSLNLATGQATSGLDEDPLSAAGIMCQVGNERNNSEPFYTPFDNPLIYYLMSWFFNRVNTKSIGDLNALVSGLTAPGFDPRHLVGFSAAREAKRLDEYRASSLSKARTPRFSPSHGWVESTMQLSLPCEKENFGIESKVPTFPVSDLFHRDVAGIVVSAFQDSEIFPTLHLMLFKEYRILGELNPPERVYSEMYNSDVFFEAWEEIQTSPGNSEDGIEHAMAALMLWSDSTCLTNFGSASLWPVYLSLGNQSKYIQTKPSSFSHHHLAYLPSVSIYGFNFVACTDNTLQLPDDIQDTYHTIFGAVPSSAIMTHLKRELMHAAYKKILNSNLNFTEAYKNGILTTCYDDIPRQIFIRLLTYSADYPEK
jgi:hypothetical protein